MLAIVNSALEGLWLQLLVLRGFVVLSALVGDEGLGAPLGSACYLSAVFHVRRR